MGSVEQMSPSVPAPLHTLPEVALALRVSVPTVRGLISCGELDAVKIGGQIRVAQAEVEHLLEASRVAVDDHAPVADEQAHGWPERTAGARHARPDEQEG
jgi:excisionase family DNA binding protein